MVISSENSALAGPAPPTVRSVPTATPFLYILQYAVQLNIPFDRVNFTLTGHQKGIFENFISFTFVYETCADTA